MAFGRKPQLTGIRTRIAQPGVLCITAALSGLMCSTATADNDGAYPSQSRTPVHVTAEDYQPTFHSLANLRALYVNVAPIKGFYSRLKLGKADPLIDTLRARVAEAGLAWLDKESVEQEPGQPTLNFYPSYKPGCCTLGLWAGFSQGAKVLSAPDKNFRLSSWGSGANHYGGEEGASCHEPATWARENVLQKMDAFLADYQRAKEQLPTRTLATVPPPTQCSSAPMLFVEIFSTGSSVVGSTQRAPLTELANTIKKCTAFNYSIESHADQRGSEVFNQQLSIKRADAIKTYLIANGVPGNRFVSRAMGENHLVSTGESSLELAANRRVVVTPIRVKTHEPNRPPPSVFRLLPQRQIPSAQNEQNRAPEKRPS